MQTHNGENPWLIIGGSGQLGQSLQLELLKCGINFIAPSSRTLDIRNFKETNSYIHRAKPSTIVNCSGWTNVQEAENNQSEANILNGYAVENLFRSTNEVSSLFIHISTDYVFSGRKGIPYKETDLTDAINVYGSSKALGEALIVNFKSDNFYIFRTAWLYSEFRNNFVKQIISRYYANESEIEIVDDQFGNPTSAFDLVKRIVKSVKSDIPFGIYHAANSGSVSWYNFALRVIELLGGKGERIKPVSSKDYISNVNRPMNSSLDTSKWVAVGMPEMQPWDKALELQILTIRNKLNISVHGNK